MNDRTEDEQVQRGGAMFPGRAVEAHQQLPRGELYEQEGQEHLRSQLFVVDGTFHAPFLGLGRTRSRQVGPEVAVIDALRGNHGENEVDSALEGVDSERGHTGFEMGGEFASLSGGGFCWLHTTKHRLFSFLSRDRIPGLTVRDDEKTKLSATELPHLRLELIQAHPKVFLEHLS